MRTRLAAALPLLLGALACGRSTASMDQRAIDAARDAGLPDHLVDSIFDASVELPEQTLTVLERCPSFDGGTGPCAPAAVAISLGTRSSCTALTDVPYYSVIATLSRWSAGLYQVGSTDPVTISFVRQQQQYGYYYPEQRYASRGALEIIACDDDSGRCAGWIDATSGAGDRVSGPFTTDEACARQQAP